VTGVLAGPGLEFELVADGAELVHRFDSMASTITVRIPARTADPRAAVLEVVDAFSRIATSCTRFDPDSELMQANAAGDRWFAVGPACLAVIEAAQQAYLETGGRFDPRVLTALRAHGYDRTFADLPADVELVRGADQPPGEPGSATLVGPPARERWRPGLHRQPPQVRIGDQPIDLGGIGKGMALRWAVHRLREHADRFLIEAGGDCYLSGSGPDGGPWLVAVEDPHGGAEPVAVLAIEDAAVATSSTRRRRWRAGGRSVHHLIDPATGQPGGAGLAAVTVVGPDPARAEVWAKVLFLAGAEGIATAAADAGLAALWVSEAGPIGVSAGLAGQLRWVAG